jgi:hypothetical protein
MQVCVVTVPIHLHSSKVEVKATSLLTPLIFILIQYNISSILVRWSITPYSPPLYFTCISETIVTASLLTHNYSLFLEAKSKLLYD